ncbi:unnamed protein product [Rotaria sordida]|uniref:Uncharacterized protein n=1 Tax=Rotaria sordida TaxID=392033 RepID=A0A814PD75_9BILA|nr:unnamed protein product [Rotaria sordida]CAF1102114.1 unnamed protein product [Rotaria sordida]
MRSFIALAVLSYILPHRNTVKAHLAKLYAQHRNSLCATLANIPAIALISDVWKNSRDLHFVSLTAHFRDANFNLISLTISFRQLVGSHITERRRKYRLYEITSLNIQNKICSITTDNATNIVAAISNVNYFDMRILCLAHIFNLILQDGLNLSDENLDDDADENEEAESSSDNDSDDEEMSLDEINLDNIIPSTGNTLLNVYYLVGGVRQFARVT